MKMYFHRVHLDTLILRIRHKNSEYKLRATMIQENRFIKVEKKKISLTGMPIHDKKIILY